MDMYCTPYMDGHYTCSGPYGTRLRNFYYTWEKKNLRPRILAIRPRKASSNDKPAQKNDTDRAGTNLSHSPDKGNLHYTFELKD